MSFRNRYRITSYPRIHVALVDIVGIGNFSPGGVGFSVSDSPLVIECDAAESLVFDGFDILDTVGQEDCKKVVGAALARYRITGIRLSLVSCPPQHCGFGSKTLLLNALVAAVNELFELNLNRSELQCLTGRGGTSGVGIQSFYTGGLIWDAGHPTVINGSTLLPSSLHTPENLPILMARWDIRDTHVLLVNVQGLQHTRQREAEIFASASGLQKEEVGELTLALYQGFLPSLVQRDQAELAKALRLIHRVGFKSFELAAQNSAVRDAYDYMNRNAFACGMSSMGPLLYCIFFAKSEALEAEKLLKREIVDADIRVAQIRNTGVEIEKLV